MQDEKPFAKDALGRDVFVAETGEIKKAGSNIDLLLELLSPFMGWKDKGKHVFVSDMSELGDFALDAEELTLLSEQIGFAVKPTDYLYEIAAKM